jgi:hypothetical protein
MASRMTTRSMTGPQMSRLERTLHTRMNLLVDLLAEGRMSEEHHDSTQAPFFLSGPTTEFQGDHKPNLELPEGLNTNLKHLYGIIGNPNVEVTLCAKDQTEWTILSQATAMKDYQKYVEDGQTRVFEFAYRYLGMGHIECLSCDLQTHNLFFHRDGGSNGYDREFHYKQMLAFQGDPDEFYFLNWVHTFL